MNSDSWTITKLFGRHITRLTEFARVSVYTTHYKEGGRGLRATLNGMILSTWMRFCAFRPFLFGAN